MKLSEEEIEECKYNSQILRQLADWHELQALSPLSVMSPEEHTARKLELRAEADLIASVFRSEAEKSLKEWLR